jgi:hypothetical protein
MDVCGIYDQLPPLVYEDVDEVCTPFEKLPPGFHSRTDMGQLYTKSPPVTIIPTRPHLSGDRMDLGRYENRLDTFFRFRYSNRRLCWETLARTGLYYTGKNVVN